MKQKPRDVATRFGKPIGSFFQKGFPEAGAVLAKWTTYLDEVTHYGPDDPLFRLRAPLLVHDRTDPQDRQRSVQGG